LYEFTNIPRVYCTVCGIEKTFSRDNKIYICLRCGRINSMQEALQELIDKCSTIIDARIADALKANKEESKTETNQNIAKTAKAK
jgi:DNA-directed RNA polymerase subunit RPC12/RpoP